jgi:hypothetical protein
MSSETKQISMAKFYSKNSFLFQFTAYKYSLFFLHKASNLHGDKKNS